MLLFGHGGSAPRRRRRIRRRPGRYTHLLVCRGQGRSRARLLRRNRLRRIRLEVRRPRLRPPPPHRPLALPRPWPKRGAARPRPRVVRRHLRRSRCRDRRGGPEESGHPRSFDGRPGRARIPPPPSGAGARTRAHLRKLWPSARHLPRLADAEDDVPRLLQAAARWPEATEFLWRAIVSGEWVYQIATHLEVNGKLVHREDFAPYFTH